MLRGFDGFETHVARELKRTLESAGVETWGLNEELAKVLGGDDAN